MDSHSNMVLILEGGGGIDPEYRVEVEVIMIKRAKNVLQSAGVRK